MKIFATIFLTLVLFPAISSAAQETESRVYVVSGNVIVSQGKNPAHQVNNSEPVVSGALVSTADNSAALLKFADGEVVTMQANSTFLVRDYHYDPVHAQNSNIVFSMLKGGMRFVTGLIGQQRKQAFRLSTPSATVGIRGTEFMLVMVGNSMYSQVLSGSIGMANAAGMSVLGAGQTAVMASSSALATLVAATAVPPGTFSALLSIPVTPSTITALPPTPVLATLPVPAVVGGVATGAAAGLAAAPIGLAMGALADHSTQEPKAVSPEAGLQKPVEPARLPDQKEKDANSKSGTGLTGKIGTLGYGGDLNFGLSDNFSARIGLNGFTYKYKANSSAVNYNFKLKLQTVSAVMDWYPFAGSFRSSIGLLYDNNKVSLGANPTGGTYTINGATYTSAQIGSLQGTLSFNKAAPYIGIGWGNPVAKDKGFGLLTDFGVLYQGAPKVNLVATCTDPLICSQLQTDATAENAKLQHNLRHFKWWPVISVGLSYQW